jgi:hypothetical protein
MVERLEGAISEATIDPRWRVVNVSFDGQSHGVLELEHPRHGRLAFLLPLNEMQEMTAALTSLIMAREHET